MEKSEIQYSKTENPCLWSFTYENQVGNKEQSAVNLSLVFLFSLFYNSEDTVCEWPKVKSIY